MFDFFLYAEGVSYAKKDYNLAKHPEIDVPLAIGDQAHAELQIQGICVRDLRLDALLLVFDQ